MSVSLVSCYYRFASKHTVEEYDKWINETRISWGLDNPAEIDNPNEPGPLQTDCEWGELTPLPNNRVLTQEEIEEINKVKLPF